MNKGKPVCGMQKLTIHDLLEGPA